MTMMLYYLYEIRWRMGPEIKANIIHAAESIFSAVMKRAKSDILRMK